MDISYSVKTFHDCLKASRSFTETAYHNLCDGSVRVVPEGTLDLIVNLGAVTAVSLIFTAMIFIPLMAVYEEIYANRRLYLD